MITRMRIKPTPLDTPCIEWTGSINVDGYGLLGNSHPAGTRVHRQVWWDARGPIPPGLVLLHRCDNPPCYRLDHLRLGTVAENQADMAAKFRQMQGEDHPKAKLTEEAVRRLRAGSLTPVQAAKLYGCSTAAARYAKRGETWRSVGVSL